MKTLIVIITLTLITSVHADFINLSPGYSYAAHRFQPPAALFDLIHSELTNQISFFDQAYATGWVRQFGVLNGGTLFNTNLVNGNPLSLALVSWNFVGTPYRMRFVDVVGTEGGDILESVYLATGKTQLNSRGFLETLLNGTVNIESISFYGVAPGNVPDGGAPALMFGAGLVGLFWVRKITRKTLDKTAF